MKSRSPIILAIVIILLVLGWMFSDDFLSTETKNSFNDNSSISNTTLGNEANNIIVSAKRVKNNLISKTIRSNAVSYPEFEISLPSDYIYEGKVAYLKSGQKMTVESLLEFILIYSANDACFAVVELFTEDTDDFLNLMNKKGQELGMNNSNFNGADFESDLNGIRRFAVGRIK